MLPIYLLAAASILNLCIAFVVLKRSTGYRKTATLFAASAVSVALWAWGDGLLLSQSDPDWIRWGGILYLVAPVFTMYFLLLFAIKFPDDTPIRRRWLWLITVPAVITTVLLVPFGEALLKIVPRGDELNSVSVSPGLYSLYSVLFAAYFFAITAIFYRKLRVAKGLKKTQIWYVFFGAFFSSVLAFVTNLFLPLIGVGELIWMGPLFTVIYMMSYTVAIAKYRLFDLRRAAGRATAYILALVSIGFAYALAVTVLRDWVEDALAVNLDTNMYYLGFTLVALIIFPSVKQKFDVLTQNIFFRNDYNVQDTIDLFGDSLIRANGKEAILAVVRSLSKKTFGAQKAYILFREDSPASAPKQRLLELFEQENVDNFIVDEMIGVSREVGSSMKQAEFALALNLKTASTNIGWLLLGEKRNGDPYDRQDVRTMNTIADEIAIALENALNYEKIADFNKTLQKKVDEATSELRETNKKLHELDESKDEFISMASHQLRTPLTTVKGYVSMLLDGDVGKITPQQRKVLEEAFSSSQRMVYLISDFLNVSRLQDGKFELEPRPIDLAEVVAQEVRQMEDSAHSRRMTLNYDRPDDIPVMMLDENKIRQVIMNFIDNAVYYSLPGDNIQITLAKHNGHVSMKVVDHGIGVPAHERHRLFAKFYRATNAKKQRPDGTGIGLFMARKVIAAHEGSIIFETAEGKGSTFGFRLPIKSRD